MGINFTDYSRNDSNWFNRKVAESCEKRSIVYNIIENFRDCAQQYLNASDIEFIHRITNVVKNITDYACTDNGSVIIRLRSKTVESCFSKTLNKAKTCATPYEDKYETFAVINLMRHMKNDHCKEKREMGKCIGTCAAKVLGTCSGFAESVFQQLVNISYEEFSCDD